MDCWDDDTDGAYPCRTCGGQGDCWTVTSDGREQLAQCQGCSGTGLQRRRDLVRVEAQHVQDASVREPKKNRVIEAALQAVETSLARSKVLGFKPRFK